MRLPYNGTYATNQTYNDPCCRASYAKFGMVGHNGIDYGLPSGTQVVAAHAGQAYVGYEANGYGNYVFITAPGVETVYGHLQSATITSGQQVSAGQVIALSDNTGNSSGAHLHFGTRPIPANNNNGFLGYVDPNIYLQGGDVSSSNLTKEEVTQYYGQVVPGRPVDAGFVSAWTGKDLGAMLRWVASDPSIQNYQNSLVHRFATPEEVIVTHKGFFGTDAPQTTIDYYSGRSIDDMLQDFEKLKDKK